GQGVTDLGLVGGGRPLQGVGQHVTGYVSVGGVAARVDTVALPEALIELPGPRRVLAELVLAQEPVGQLAEALDEGRVQRSTGAHLKDGDVQTEPAVRLDDQ